MAKDERLFAPFPIEMDEHPKIITLSDAAFRAIIEATFYSRRMLSDGFLDERVVLKRWGQVVADELASNDPERPSWVRVDHGWQIHDFEKHHPLRAEIEAKRDAVSLKRSEAGKRGGEASAQARRKQSGSKSEANSTSETETETETQAVTKQLSPTATDLAFATAWEHWPKKTERKKALERFRAAAKHVTPTTLGGHVIRFGDAYAATTARQFVPALAVWLYGERWDDELPTNGEQPKKQTSAERALALSEELRRREDATITDQLAIG